MHSSDSLVDATDGRVLEVTTQGDPSGRTVLFHHGSPGSSSLISFFDDVTYEVNLFFVSISRPGYGASTRLEGRSIAAVVEDARTVLDHLGRDEYVAAGWSGGGPHALACAALDRPRCRAAWSLAGVVPIDVDFDWTAGMGPENVEEFALSLQGGPEYEAMMVQSAREFSTATPENIISLFGGLVSDVDKRALQNDAARAALAYSCRHAFANGWHGFYDDDRAFFSPWGFDPTAITAPVGVWYGDEDLMVPSSHGKWLGDHLPTASVTHLAAEGHVSLIINHVDELARGFDRAFE